jgi:hypothetical protein
VAGCPALQRAVQGEGSGGFCAKGWRGLPLELVWACGKPYVVRSFLRATVVPAGGMPRSVQSAPEPLEVVLAHGKHLFVSGYLCPSCWKWCGPAEEGCAEGRGPVRTCMAWPASRSTHRPCATAVWRLASIPDPDATGPELFLLSLCLSDDSSPLLFLRLLHKKCQMPVVWLLASAIRFSQGRRRQGCQVTGKIFRPFCTAKIPQTRRSYCGEGRPLLRANLRSCLVTKGSLDHGCLKDGFAQLTGVSMMPQLPVACERVLR